MEISKVNGEALQSQPSFILYNNIILSYAWRPSPLNFYT